MAPRPTPPQHAPEVWSSTAGRSGPQQLADEMRPELAAELAGPPRDSPRSGATLRAAPRGEIGPRGAPRDYRPTTDPATRALESGLQLEEAEDELTAAGVTVVANLDRARKSIQRGTSLISELDAEGVEQVKEPTEQVGKALTQLRSGLAAHAADLLKPKK